MVAHRWCTKAPAMPPGPELRYLYVHLRLGSYIDDQDSSQRSKLGSRLGSRAQPARPQSHPHPISPHFTLNKRSVGLLDSDRRGHAGRSGHQHAKSTPQSCSRSSTLPTACARSKPARHPCPVPPPFNGRPLVPLPVWGRPDLFVRRRGNGLNVEGLSSVVVDTRQEHEGHAVSFLINSSQDILVFQAVLPRPWLKQDNSLFWVESVKTDLGLNQISIRRKSLFNGKQI